MSRKRIDFKTGDIVGDLLILEDLGVDHHGNRIWKCKCKCGNECVRRSTGLKAVQDRGFINSCGCRRNMKKVVDLSPL